MQSVATRKQSIVGEGVIARVAVSNVVLVVLGGFFVLRNRYFAQIARVLVIVTMRSVAHYVLVICMALIRCHCAVILLLLWRMLLLSAVLIVLSVMMFSLLFSFIIVIASTVIKMGMIMSLLPLH